MNVVAGIGGKERIEEDDILPQINLNVGTANVRDNVRDRIKELRRQEEYLQLGASGEHEKFRTDRDSSSRHKQDVVLSHSDVNKTLWQSQAKQSFKGLSSKTISSDVTQPPDTDEVTQVESQPIVRVPRLYKSQLVTGCSDLPTNNSTDHTTNQLMFPRNGKYRILTTKSVIATVHLPKEGLEEMATQGCIHPHYSSLQLDTIPEVVSPWRPVESNEGRRFTNLIAPWWSQADMCVLHGDLENNSVEPLPSLTENVGEM